MSVATEFAPEVFIPPQARPAGRPVRRRCGDVVVPLRPADVVFDGSAGRVASTEFDRPRLYGTAHAELAPLPRPVADPARLRLTRRGVAVLAVGTAVLGAALLLLAWRSAPGRPAMSAAPAVVSVQAGDTLWSIASRVAPHRDPRDEVADLQRLNKIVDAQLQPGQVLRTR